MYFPKCIIMLAAVHLLPAECRTATPLTRHWDVATTQGRVRGYYVPHPPHFAFLGIPYSRPPTRYDRFKAPKAPLSWDGMFEATHHVKCPQPDGDGDENCLVVNVFTPVKGAALPVLVHIHGERFLKGWGSHHAPQRLLRRNLVFVTLNYRLGILGFLSFKTYGIAGNAGLKDQVAALYWINKNIASFGGNPRDVTLYGTGSGAMTVELIMLSGSADDLFQKIIIESGTALSPSSLSRGLDLDTAFELAKQLGYEGNDNLANIENFFYRISFKKLTNSSFVFLPVIENKNLYTTLLDKDPREIIERGAFRKTPMILTHTNADEVTVIKDNVNKFKVVPEKFEELLPNNLKFDNDKLKESIAKLTKEIYFGEITSDNPVKNYINYVNDIFITYPMLKSSIHYAYKNKNAVFIMNFLNNFNDKSQDVKGASCGDINKYIFSDMTLENDDEIIAEQLVSLWTNFIILGDPTPLTTSQIPVIWQPLKPRETNGKPDIKSIQWLIFGRTIKNKELTSPELIYWEHIYSKFYSKI